MEHNNIILKSEGYSDDIDLFDKMFCYESIKLFNENELCSYIDNVNKIHYESKNLCCYYTLYVCVKCGVEKLSIALYTKNREILFEKVIIVKNH